MLPRSVSVGFDVEYRRALNGREVRSTRFLGSSFHFYPKSSKADNRSGSELRHVAIPDGSTFYYPNNKGCGLSSDLRIFSQLGHRFSRRHPRGIRKAGVAISFFTYYGSQRLSPSRFPNRVEILAPLSIGRFKPGLGVPHFSFGVSSDAPCDGILDIPPDLFQVWANSERQMAYAPISLAPRPFSSKSWGGRTWEIFRQYLKSFDSE
jgi:hypothetical protein